MASVSIRRRDVKSGARFQVRYRLGGRAYPLVHAGSFETLKEARLRRDLIAGELAASRNPATTLRALVETTERRTFARWAEAYTASRVDLASTEYVEMHLKRMTCFHDRDPFTITVADVQEWVGANADLKTTSLKRYLGTLRLILDHADVEPNPARDKRIRLPRGEHEEVNPPTAKQFLAILDNAPRARRLALIVMEQTAMAVGETTKLAWGDVDVAESQFRLQRRNVKGQIASRARWVQVPRWLMDLIEDTCPLDDRTAERAVFGCTTDAYRNVMDRACTTAGLPRFSPHDLRHRRLSLWHRQGVPARELAARAGHSKSSMTLDVYSHVLIDPAEVAEDTFRALIER